MEIELIISILALATNIILVGVVFLNNPTSRTNRTFAYLGLAIAFWILSILLDDLNSNILWVLFWNRAAIIGPVLLPPLFLSLILQLYYQGIAKHQIVKKLFFAIAFVFIVFSSTSFNIKEVSVVNGTIAYTIGPLYYFLLPYLVIGFAWTFFLLIKTYTHAKNPEKSQAKFILIGTILPIILSIVTNLILPVL